MLLSRRLNWVTMSSVPVAFATAAAGVIVPAGPVGPVGPTAPAGPVGPIAPAAPAGPVGPIAPAAPTGPVGPIAPAAPAGPVGPIAPAAPAGPVGPIVPAAPTGPVGPVAPAAQGNPAARWDRSGRWRQGSPGGRWGPLGPPCRAWAADSRAAGTGSPGSTRRSRRNLDSVSSQQPFLSEGRLMPPPLSQSMHESAVDGPGKRTKEKLPRKGQLYSLSKKSLSWIFARKSLAEFRHPQMTE